MTKEALGEEGGGISELLGHSSFWALLGAPRTAHDSTVPVVSISACACKPCKALPVRPAILSSARLSRRPCRRHTSSALTPDVWRSAAVLGLDFVGILLWLRKNFARFEASEMLPIQASQPPRVVTTEALTNAVSIALTASGFTSSQ